MLKQDLVDIFITEALDIITIITQGIIIVIIAITQGIITIQDIITGITTTTDQGLAFIFVSENK